MILLQKYRDLSSRQSAVAPSQFLRILGHLFARRSGGYPMTDLSSVRSYWIRTSLLRAQLFWRRLSSSSFLQSAPNSLATQTGAPTQCFDHCSLTRIDLAQTERGTSRQLCQAFDLGIFKISVAQCRGTGVAIQAGLQRCKKPRSKPTITA